MGLLSFQPDYDTWISLVPIALFASLSRRGLDTRNVSCAKTPPAKRREKSDGDENGIGDMKGMSPGSAAPVLTFVSFLPSCGAWSRANTCIETKVKQACHTGLKLDDFKAGLIPLRDNKFTVRQLKKNTATKNFQTLRLEK